MPLEEYKRKRDFARTPEPSGRARPGRPGFRFVVQKHAASRLHYDFRLELDGVLKSWAVPKGPSLDPAQKRLAMETEDHPLEYAEFEGIIPEGEYGAGTVLVWDRGTWEPLDDPRAGYAQGRLKFRLNGEKLRGGWTLVRIRGRNPREQGKTWLLIKERDQAALPASEHDVTAARPESVLTGRDLEQVGRERDDTWSSSAEERPSARRRRTVDPAAREARVPGARRARASATAAGSPLLDPSTIPGARRGPLPSFVPPQLATLVDEAPDGPDWLHEIKYDGYRIQCRVADGKVSLVSRNAKDWTDAFPSVARAAPHLPCRQALLDGEVAVVLPGGITSFNALQNAMGGGQEKRLVYFAFDLLHLDGYDLRGARLEDRKGALHALLAAAGAQALPFRYSDHAVGNGAKAFELACRMKLEGIVSKRRDDPHHSGRGRSWLKVKCSREQEFVIGGFTDPEGRRTGLGALLLGVYENGRLRYVGKVGTGFTERAARELRRTLEAIERSTPAFDPPPAGVRGAHWVEPRRVAEVEFTEWTPDGKLRHPSFKGLREDKPAHQIVREEPTRTGTVAERDPPRTETLAARPPRRGVRAAAELVAGVRLTHPDRVLYPAPGITKRELAGFYEEIADWILPHLRSRPTALVRCPEGVTGSCFYQKHGRIWAPEALRRVEIGEKTKVGQYLVVDDLPGLIGLVQMDILEIHTWNSRFEHLEQPDRIVFDLDPAEDVSWRRVVDAARLLREELGALGLQSFVKTTGGKGLHVVVPISLGPGWDPCLEFARSMAQRIADDRPRDFVATASKAQRAGRIFLDYLRNLRGATAVSAYSTRARPEAPVSTPLRWEELEPRMRSDQYTVRNMRRRLAALREDPWEAYHRLRQTLPASPAPERGPRRRPGGLASRAR